MLIKKYHYLFILCFMVLACAQKPQYNKADSSIIGSTDPSHLRKIYCAQYETCTDNNSKLVPATETSMKSPSLSEIFCNYYGKKGRVGSIYKKQLDKCSKFLKRIEAELLKNTFTFSKKISTTTHLADLEKTHYLDHCGSSGYYFCSSNHILEPENPPSSQETTLCLKKEVQKTSIQLKSYANRACRQNKKSLLCSKENLDKLKKLIHSNIPSIQIDPILPPKT